MSKPALSSADRARLMQVGLLATATGRNHRDVKRSLMAGEIVGRPVAIDKALPAPSYRAALHAGTMLTPPQRQAR
jgi:hypothetical protein